MKLHGLTECGDADDGDEAGAKAIMDAARAYQRDSSAYVEQHFGAVIDDASQSSSGPANASAVAATFTAPTMDLAKAANPSPLEQKPEERRVGKECGSTGSSGWSTYHSKKKNKRTK